MADLVPVGEDQLPVIEVTRKIVRKFNQLYGEVLKEPNTLLGNCPRLIGLDGKSKMSKSIGNAIFLSDTKSEISAKILKAVTDPNRVRINDKGNPKICNIYQYHKVFNKNESSNIYSMCQSATIGCATCKNLLINKLDDLLTPFREKRVYYENKQSMLKEILDEGNKKAIEEGTKTLNLIKNAMKIDY